MASISLIEPADPGAPRRPAAMLGLLLLGVGALGSAALLLLTIRDPLFAGAFAAAVLATGALMLARTRLAAPAMAASPIGPDIALLRAAVDSSSCAIAIVDGDDRLICSNRCYAEWFGTARAPGDLAGDNDSLSMLIERARCDGQARADRVRVGEQIMRAEVTRQGHDQSYLLWRFSREEDGELAAETRRLLSGEAGRRIGEAGMMAVLANAEGRVLCANQAFQLRTAGRSSGPVADSLVTLLAANEDGQFCFAHEGKGAVPLRILQIPLSEGADSLTLFILLDDPAGTFASIGRTESGNINALLDILPLGLALANVDGRFVYLNKAFRKGAGLAKDTRPVYPGDLVVHEDKAAVSDLVRRFARGPSAGGDMAVRLMARPDEPVALTIAGIRGLGEA